nr:response regulator [Gloeocapsa sp. PCC 73106]
MGVDDDPLLLATLNSLFTPWGIKFMGVDNPREVWHKLKIFKPDLLILDVNMPQIGGIDLCRALRNDRSWQDLPILFLTAEGDLEIIQQIFTAGADDYLIKPVVAPELLTRINYRLERKQMWQKYRQRDVLTGLLNQPQSWFSNEFDDPFNTGYERVFLAYFIRTNILIHFR